MKIAAALTSMDAARTYTEVNSFTLGLQTQQQAAPLNQDPFNTRFRSLISNSSAPSFEPVPSLDPCHVIGTEPEGQRSTDDANDVLRTLTGEIVGRPIHLVATDNNEDIVREHNPPSTMQATITSRLVHYEKEEVYFSSNGTISTEDGREFSFALDLSMQRTMVETSEVSITGGPVTRYLLDPLVLSFTGGPPAFSTSSFLFDLDCDGQEDKIAGLQPGCGFLAFDQNEDGLINNGLELFGPHSGNGFTDLAALDTDSNLWIDENDPVFESLSIWHPNDQGENTLLSLKEAGVGAISLSHAGTQFTLQGADNEVIAQVSANGIFLTENGEVRSLQEVDLAIGDAKQDDRSAQTEVLDALFTMRIIIAMQQMRVRLMIARNRLEKPPQQLPFTTAQHLHPHLKTAQALEGGADKPNIPNLIEKKTEDSDPMGLMDTMPTRHRMAQLRTQHDAVLRPMLSLDEMHDLALTEKSYQTKKPHSSSQ